MIILDVQDICKYYGTGKKRQTGCEHISFTAESGQIYSLLGLNGAGKSTVLNIISGYRRPNSGDVLICGSSILDDPAAAKSNTGILYEQNPLYDSMTVEEFLLFTLEMRGIGGGIQQEMLAEALEFTGLEEVYTRCIRGLSKGYRQRVGFAQAIIHHPRLILLDEPASGLDPLQLQDFEKKVLTLSTHAAVILCTHQLEMAERICSRHILLHKGRQIAAGTRAELAEQLSDDAGTEEDAASERLLFRAFEYYAGVTTREFREEAEPLYAGGGKRGQR